MLTQRRLEQVGSEGRFQVYSVIFVALMWTVTSIIIFLPSYLIITPTFTCSGTSGLQENEACPVLSTCTIDQPRTITDYVGLYCDNLYVRNTIQSSQFIGSIIGLLILSLMADKLGRKTITILGLIICIIGSTFLTIGPRFKLIQLIYIGIILIGFGAYSLTVVTYAYICEICSQKWRERSLLVTFCFESIGEMLMYPIIVYIDNWMLILCFTYILPLVVLLVMSFFIIQPPEYLYSIKKYEECLASLNSIARFNGRPELECLSEVGEENQQQPQQAQQPQQPQQPSSLQSAQRSGMASLLSCEYLVPLLVLSIAYFCSNGYYYTVQYSLDEYGYGFQINVLLIGGLQLVSCFVTSFVYPKVKRKVAIITVILVSAGLGICDQFITSQLADFIIVSFIQVLNTVIMALLFIIGSQIFPPEIRSRGLGFAEAISMLGDMAAPFLVTLAINADVKSVFIGGFMNVAAGLVMLLVKETKKDQSQGSEIQNNTEQGLQNTTQPAEPVVKPKGSLQIIGSATTLA